MTKLTIKTTARDKHAMKSKPVHRLLRACLAVAMLAVAPTVVFAQAAPAAASEASPSKLVLDNSTRVLTALESRRAEFSKDRAALSTFINSEFNSMFDRDYAARQVLGRHARDASDADVKLFADALAGSLMQRYGASLLDFNTKLRVKVKSETALPRGIGVKVATELQRTGAEAIPVDYLMRRTGGTWKVFDVMVEGVSFVQTFRQQFDAELQRKSIKQVAAELRNGQISADAGK